MKIKRVIVFFLAVFIFLSARETALAWPSFNFPEINFPDFSLPTNTPTPTIKIGVFKPGFKLPPGIFASTTTPTPTLTETPTPTEEIPSETPAEAGKTLTAAPTASTMTPTPTEKSQAGTILGLTKKELAMWVVILAIFFLVLAQSWPKIKAWLHEKTK